MYVLMQKESENHVQSPGFYNLPALKISWYKIKLINK